MGIKSSSEYEIPANIPKYVIQDIIKWVNATKNKKHQNPLNNHYDVKDF